MKNVRKIILFIILINCSTTDYIDDIENIDINDEAQKRASCFVDLIESYTFQHGINYLTLKDKNKNIKPIIFKYDELSNYSEGLALFKKINKYGYIDKNEKVVIKSKFEHAGNFYNGLAYVEVSKNKHGYIDKKGKVVITGSLGIFSDGLAKIRVKGKKGYINPKGKMVIKPRFDEAGSFSEGLAKVKLNFEDKYGYINRKGEVNIKPQFDDARDFSNGLAAVRIYNISDKYGFIDTKGKLVIQPKFKEVGYRFSEGLIPVYIK